MPAPYGVAWAPALPVVILSERFRTRTGETESRPSVAAGARSVPETWSREMALSMSS